MDLPTSWTMAAPGADEFTSRMFGAINSMLLDVLAALSRKDFEDRRRRQARCGTIWILLAPSPPWAEAWFTSFFDATSRGVARMIGGS